MVPRNALGFPEMTFWIQHSLKNSTRLTPIVQLPGAGVDHHDAGVGPQERAVERGILSRIGQALPSVNHNDPHHLSSNHAHLHLITTVIYPVKEHTPQFTLCPISYTRRGLYSCYYQAEYLPYYTYLLILTSCVCSLCSPLSPDRLSPWSVCSWRFPRLVGTSYLWTKGHSLYIANPSSVQTSEVIHSPQVSTAQPSKAHQVQ